MAGGIQNRADFNGANGATPTRNASLTLGTDGLFYGTTGVNIFSFNPTGNVLTNLASFNGANGANPLASLTLGMDGLFYGTTGGGTYGTIFSFDPHSSTPNPSTQVPEPSALLGTTIAVALGATLKRKSAHKPKK